MTAKWKHGGSKCSFCAKGASVLHVIAGREVCRDCIEKPKVIYGLRAISAEKTERVA